MGFYLEGKYLEKGGINFSDVWGTSLPKAATQDRPELAGAPFRAMGVSVVFHPFNPHIPTSHANVRFFQVNPEGKILLVVWRRFRSDTILSNTG